MDYNKIASDIVSNVGGKENIQSVTHCFTRLRFVLKDESKAKKSVVEHLEGVIQVVEAGGQFQVVCGTKVEKIYDAVVSQVGEQLAGGEVSADGDAGKQSIGNVILQKITQMFTPLVPAIAAAGLIKGLLTAANLLCKNVWGFGIDTSSTYTILVAASDVIFYFMPIFLAMTTAKAMKCNQVIAMCIGGLLCYPAMDAIIQDVATITTIFGLPVTKMAWTIGDATKVFSYTSSVIPVILAVLVMAFLERFLKKFVPEVLQIILVPGLELLIMVPLTLVVLGPVGMYVGNGIQWVYDSIMGISTILGGALIGGLWGVCVIFGAHRALLPIGINDVATNGHQNLLAFAGAANFAQGGAALGVMLKTKSKELKQVAASSTIAAALVGITEPAIYGVNLRLKKPMIYAIICGAIGGGIMGLGNVYGDAFANNGVLTIFTYAAFGLTQFVFYLVGIAIAFFGAAAMSYFFGFDDIDTEGDLSSGTTTTATPTKQVSVNEADIVIDAPVEGKAVELSSISDTVFSSNAMGKGIAIIPTKGEVVAPCDCTVSVLYPTLHAIGLMLDNGVELLIHIGMNTVELKGEGFKKYVEQGAKVKKGDKIVSFDINAIKAKGYDITTPVIITNTQDYNNVSGVVTSAASLSTPVITIKK